MEKTNEISTLASRSQRHCVNSKRWTWGKFFISLLLVTYLTMFIFMLLDLNTFQSIMKSWWGLKYIVLLGFAAVMTYVSRQQEQDKNSGLLSTLICCGILLLAFIFLAVFMFGMVSLTVDFYLMLVAVTFFVPPIFYLVLAVLNIVNARLLRLLVATVASFIIVGHALMIFGTYEISKTGKAEMYQKKQLLEYSFVAVNYGFNAIDMKSLTKEKEVDSESVVLIFLGVYGTAIVAYIGTIAGKENTRRIDAQTRNQCKMRI